MAVAKSLEKAETRKKSSTFLPSFISIHLSLRMKSKKFKIEKKSITSIKYSYKKMFKNFIKKHFLNKVTNILIDISISFFQHKFFQTVTIMWGNLT